MMMLLAVSTMSAKQVIVMDTAQALLSGAQVRIGRTVLRTSFDGQVELTAQQCAHRRFLRVSCEGHKTQRLRVAQVIQGEQAYIVQLVPTVEKKRTPAPRGKGTLWRDKLAAEGDIFYSERGYTTAAGYYPGYNKNAQAGMLTAGEVNDFTKWSLWPNILEKTHKPFADLWRIVPKERYTVSVTDQHGYPIANYPVQLTDRQGNTLFQAMTDNTGKAELWNGLTGEQVVVNKPQSAIIVDDECDQSRDVDVLFVFDATGSMGDELRFLQEEMKDVITCASAATGGLNIRTGAVVYRDHSDAYLTRLSRLTDDISVTQAFIDKQEAQGGGDYEEAVPEALMAALNSAGFNEQARARIIFLILDAPCHEDSATIALLHDQVLTAAAMGVRIVPVVCSGLQPSGEYLMRAIALATNGTSFFLTDDSGIGHEHLQPTTDSLQVEHLNDMMVRTIVAFSYMPDCTGHWHEDQIDRIDEQRILPPFNEDELEQHPDLPHGPTTLFLQDISGKLIAIYQGYIDEAGEGQLAFLNLSLPTGVYIVRAYCDGKWVTKKILVH